jgi:hypothetical protein
MYFTDFTNFKTYIVIFSTWIPAHLACLMTQGTFFVKNTPWSLDLMGIIWGDSKTSPWVDHPWWENAALTWHFLKDVVLKISSATIQIIKLKI